MAGTLRFRYRHVHATLFHYVRDQLVDLGWGDASLPLTDTDNASINFGGTPATYIDFQPEEVGASIVDNTIAITLGDEPASLDQELGGGLQQLALPLFVDVYGATQAVAQSIASDVKDILEDVFMAVNDYTDSTVATTADQIELDKDDLLVERPQVALSAVDVRRNWRVVKTFARINYVSGAE